MIEGLNEQQSLAVTAVDGPVIVFAGAGSGKTRTLTYRIVHMIYDCNISPDSILAITFTNKATNEMRMRLEYLKSGKNDNINLQSLTVSTFHSFCVRILRKEISILNDSYSNDFTILDEDDQLKIIHDVLKENGREKGAARKLQKIFNFNKCFMTVPENPDEEELLEKYNEKLKSLNSLDFEDLLQKVFEIFTNHPSVLFKYQKKYKYILIDEFQDTNTVQYEISKMLAADNHNIFVVGDDDQSIYSFRGANYENMERFKRDFPEYKLFTLTQNYRSTQHILDYCNRLIANNNNRQQKNMESEIVGTIDDVVVHTANNEYEEVEYVCQSIAALKSANNNYTDFAILYRSSVLLRNVEIALIRLGLPYKVYGGMSYLRRREIKDVIAYFKLMMNYNDLMAFKRIVNVPNRGIGTITIDKIEKIKKLYKLDLFEAITWTETLLNQKKFEGLCSFRELIIRYAKRLETDDLLDLFDDLMNEIGYYDYLKSEYDAEDAIERINNLKEFKSILYSVETIEPDRDKISKLKEVIDEALLSEDHLQSQKENRNGITVSTVHSVKGLEFSYVFIIGLEEEIFPNSQRIRNLEEFEEERRIAYVAMTRAKQKLFLCHAQKRLLYGKYFFNEPSRFLLESVGVKTLDENEKVVIEEDKTKEEKKINIMRDKSLDGDYNISDQVEHKVFGDGIILGIDNGIGIIFFFKEKETKKIKLSHPSLTKK